ncbi:MAG: hypothetical protein A2234_01730 [Elusimicrobia bacterium RIFOXYA2_FULL_58_8]|nr:MAG: hypothetical protein A2285_08445 [Elusimicrobia bacterium RIFOXYA12_FULL_57_11]OGS12306.1 MAG: hypothetical protein A2234_01730 [Elusimicrobia bacterium RIFOXYA2_FULL_58_8]
MNLPSLNAFLAGIFCLTIFSGPCAFAQDTARFSKSEADLAFRYPDAFTINPASVRVTLISVDEEPDMDYVKLQERPGDLNSVLVSIEKIVNIAEKIWQIVDANKPVVNIESKYATAYPEGITSASQLSSWSKPKVASYAFYAENLYGAVMVNAKYKVAFSYNGTYKGKGKYLTGVAVIPTMADVGWGYRFYMSAAVPDSTIANTGTDAAPVAAMQLKLSWKIATALKQSDGTSVYYVQGDGYFEEIASPWKRNELRVEDLGSAAPLLTPGKVF